MKPIDYWRQNKKWSKFLGKRGRVIAASTVCVSGAEQADFAPYVYCLIQFGNERHEFMGCGHEKINVGDHVQCVLRRVAVNDSDDIIPYGIKVRKI